MSKPDVTGRSPADNTLPHGTVMAPGRRSTSLSDRHLSKLAIVYVRQSSAQQIFEHKESRERQYALADYAALLGWPRERIVVIDEDQGRSGRTAEQRPGFQRLLAEVTLDHVGLVLGLELSRLSRSSKDWYQARGQKHQQGGSSCVNPESPSSPPAPAPANTPDQSEPTVAGAAGRQPRATAAGAQPCRGRSPRVVSGSRGGDA